MYFYNKLNPIGEMKRKAIPSDRGKLQSLDLNPFLKGCFTRSLDPGKGAMANKKSC